MSHNADDDSSYQLYLEPQKQGGGRQDDPHPQHSSTSGRTSLGAYEYSQPSARDQHSLGEQPPLGAYGYSQLSSGDYEYSQASTGDHKYSQFSSASYEDSQASTGDHEYSQSSSATYRYSQPSARDHEYSHSSSGFSTVQQTWPRYYYETPSENELENEDPVNRHLVLSSSQSTDLSFSILPFQLQKPLPLTNTNPEWGIHCSIIFLQPLEIPCILGMQIITSPLEILLPSPNRTPTNSLLSQPGQP
ncbi:hypothetical protein DFH05DRAFT_1129113 [Lentinula detonsa]|uniref:Uncharacterized protein n=1 Tax=Lentinula detonsa TaxID=2804962 RepID=A0A9W8NZK1_9AGAR|nr:hypothetical protein DFH05DRAFT_1129113 [Lentinula detonsa]